MDYFTLILIVLLFLIIVIFVIWIVMESSYKQKVIIREIVNGRKYVITDRAKEFTDNEKVVWWKLRKEKDKIKKLMPMPPPEATEITKRGKKFVEVYRTEMGEYIFINDTGNIKPIPKEIVDEIEDIKNREDVKGIYDDKEKEIKINQIKQKIITEWRTKNNIIQPLKPLTKEQRMSLVNSIKKAEIRKKSDWKNDLPMYASFGFITLILIMFLIFGPDLITTYTKGAEQVSSSLTQYEKIRHANLMEEQKNWEKISAGIQTIHEIQNENQRRLTELEKDKDD